MGDKTVVTTCQDCDLHGGCKHPNMASDTSGLLGGKCDVMIIGEAPGFDESVAGVPFVGASGQLLRTIVGDAGLTEYGVVYSNVVRCRPPENATPTNKQIAACAPKVLAEIDAFNPRAVILLGNTPLKAVLGKTGITNWRGSRLEHDNRVYLPMFHPAYILRQQSNLPTLLSDMEQAYNIISGSDVGTKRVTDAYKTEIVTTLAQAQEMLACIVKAGTVAFDTESRSAKPFAPGAKMLMLSFAVNKHEKRAWVVPADNDIVRGYCERIFSDARIKKIGHNAKYDQLTIWAAWGVEVVGIVGDSML